MAKVTHPPTQDLLAAAETAHELIQWLGELCFYSPKNADRIADTLEALALAIQRAKEAEDATS